MKIFHASCNGETFLYEGTAKASGLEGWALDQYIDLVPLDEVNTLKEQIRNLIGCVHNDNLSYKGIYDVILSMEKLLDD